MHNHLLRKPLVTGLLAASVALGFAAPALAANIVNNGGFEAGSFSGWSGSVLSSPYSGVYCPGAGAAPENNCQAFLGTNGASVTLSQVLATVAGQSYAVSFSFKPDGSSPSSFSVSFGNQTLYNVVNPVLAAPQTLNFTAAATGTSTALVFNARNDPGYFFLDAVSVSPVPEPAPVVLAAVGLIGLLATQRRRARRPAAGR